MSTVNEKMTAIAEPIRTVLGTAQLLTLDDMAASIPEVYSKGRTDGNADGQAIGYDRGLAEGIEQGKQAEYNAFWDIFQQNGNREIYTNAFQTAGWNNENFKPKHSMTPTNASYMFEQSNIQGDLVEILEDLGITLDFSKATNIGALFSTTKFTRIGVVDVTSVTTPSYAQRVFLYNYYLKTIDKIITNSNITYQYWFNNCNELEEVRFEGEIANSVDIHWSTKLSAQSFVSIVERLSSTTSGKTLTVSSTAVANADWSTTNYASWDELIASKTNWTFAKS